MHNIDAIIDDAVTQYIKEGKATRISVWTRDLETNQWASTNEYDRYAPASMMKVPVMIAYLKLAEYQPSVLSEQLPYAVSSTYSDDEQNFQSSAIMVTGQKYTVSELINDMIIDSDNNALSVLLSNLDPQILTDTLVNLGIEIPKDAKTYDFMTAKSYANIFRNLYNASYLNRADSQTALALLSKSTFKGIASPLPPNVTVAHKFGERKILNADGSTQEIELHDCGIVYKPPDPYSLCIMSAGSNFKDLQTIISDISSVLYQNM